MAPSPSTAFSIRLLAFALPFALLLGNAVLRAQASVHYYDFVLRETNITRNCTSWRLLLVNDSFPGPTIEVHKGDLVFVNVHNQGDYGVTLHWHGVKQPRNPWSDGPEYITQCPIPPGTNFTYEVNFTTEEGTLWWHAHSVWTRATVHGAIVILPEEGTTYPFPKPDGEEIIVLGSWYSEGDDLNSGVGVSLETGEAMPESIGYMINGEFGDFVACSQDSTYHMYVEYGKTYLLRIINAVVGAELFFAIADHNLTVVGMDASYTGPLVSPYLTTSPGSTLDVIFTANKTPGRYYMAVRRYTSQDTDVTDFNHMVATAILHYSGNYSLDTSPKFPNRSLPGYYDYSGADTFTFKLRGLASKEHPSDVPLNITRRMFITLSMNEILCPHHDCIVAPTTLGSSLNNQSWDDPSTDVLQAYYKNISGVYTADFPDFPPFAYNWTGADNPDAWGVANKVTRVKMLEYNESVEVVFQDSGVLQGAQRHPMHMHGYSFYVVGHGLGNFDNETDPLEYNLLDPPLVNTFSVPRDGWIAIRFVANNPGVWFWHCHIDKHMSWGMDTVFIVKDGGTEETSMRGPPSYMPPCEDSYNIARMKSRRLPRQISRI
ncbi:putative laccase-9 [Eucalyptus grandis]|nr:putative laccase-9 [Eucalyptus grandis]